MCFWWVFWCLLVCIWVFVCVCCLLIFDVFWRIWVLPFLCLCLLFLRGFWCVLVFLDVFVCLSFRCLLVFVVFGGSFGWSLCAFGSVCLGLFGGLCYLVSDLSSLFSLFAGGVAMLCHSIETLCQGVLSLVCQMPRVLLGVVGGLQGRWFAACYHVMLWVSSIHGVATRCSALSSISIVFGDVCITLGSISSVGFH